MTTSGGQGARPRRWIERGQVGAAAIVGLLDGVGLAVLVAGFGWWSLGGWDEAAESVGGWLLLTLTAVVLAGAWFAGSALLRRKGLQRARSIVSWSLGLSAVLVAVLTAIAGWVAVVIGTFSALLLWSGDYVDDIAVTAVLLVSAAAVLLSTSVCLLVTVVLANPPPPVGAGPGWRSA
ncbi:hypothetical protein NVV95_14725 [Herbiconiux sp. CPCC 205716]|uniref:DUF3180 domain-containing protein n=1 Tax=Herbiconiux gentiana TaxID=2970912 RepID=A0ABT2GHU7_9MICO|nr:hypothetical protein [Herbiconiux gentiana]MCS5715803.1 hypothetical protein [Herbiconiux gentiana]